MQESRCAIKIHKKHLAITGSVLVVIFLLCGLFYEQLLKLFEQETTALLLLSPLSILSWLIFPGSALAAFLAGTICLLLEIAKPLKICLEKNVLICSALAFQLILWFIPANEIVPGIVFFEVYIGMLFLLCSPVFLSLIWRSRKR